MKSGGELRAHLRARNLFMKRELDSLERALGEADVTPFLRPFARRLGVLCRNQQQSIQSTLRDLESGDDSILQDLLSDTCNISRVVRLLAQQMAAPVLRSSPDDEAALRVISWMHGQHPRTCHIAAACAVGDVRVWPITAFAPVYFFPALEGRGLLYLTLFFHEFGHLLYALHRPELDDLVKELRETIEARLQPMSGRNNWRAESRAARTQIIVNNWYFWASELFCDAVGLHMGGPAYLHAFSAYCGNFARGDFDSTPADLDKSTHPVNWLRVRLLAKRARSLGWGEAARAVEAEWQVIAHQLDAEGDYHGYYDEDWEAFVVGTISDMLTSAGLEDALPAFEQDEADFSRPWEPGASPVVLLNQAWRQVHALPATEFAAWEADAMRRFLAEPCENLSEEQA